MITSRCSGKERRKSSLGRSKVSAKLGVGEGVCTTENASGCLPWSQRVFLNFHRMRELRESREAAKTGREAALSQLSHMVNIIIINMGEKSKKPLGLG